MEVKIMIVPGKIARVEIPAGATVIAVAEQAERQIPGIGWVQLIKEREVRVQNRTFSNTEEPGTHAGSIHTTSVNDGDVILILTKIKGNAGKAVLTCRVNGAEFALETPCTITHLLAEVVGYDLSKVKAVYVNGDDSPLDQLVGAGDDISVEFFADEPEEEIVSETGEVLGAEVAVVVNGHTITGKPEDIRRIILGV